MNKIAPRLRQIDLSTGEHVLTIFRCSGDTAQLEGVGVGLPMDLEQNIPIHTQLHPHPDPSNKLTIIYNNKIYKICVYFILEYYSFSTFTNVKFISRRKMSSN
jgi:hypothetical protein